MARILIVDDEPLNRELLHAFFEDEGHELVEAQTGEEALTRAAELPPDLVLLDVMMPGMDGFETCTALKAQARDEFLPIVLVTALGDHASRVKGLRTGADDFLTKPVDRQELRARTSNLLMLREKELALVQRSTRFAELNRFKDEMSEMIVHDLKNPLAAVLANLDYVIDQPNELEEPALDALRDARTASRRALRLIHNLVDVARMEAGRIELRRTPTPFGHLLTPVIRQRTAAARNRGITLVDAVNTEVRLDADADLVTRVVENLYDNSLRYTPPGGRILAWGESDGKGAQLHIGNTGPPIPAEARELVFEKFGHRSSKTGRMNLGLGLYFCRLAAEAHGGRIWVEETKDLPTVFNLSLPAAGLPSTQQV